MAGRSRKPDALSPLEIFRAVRDVWPDDKHDIGAHFGQ